MGCANFKLLQISTDSRTTIVLIDDARSRKKKSELLVKYTKLHNSVDAIPKQK